MWFITIIQMYKLETSSWYLERAVYFIAGFFVMVSVFLAVYVNENFLYLTGLVAFMLMFFSLTGLCPMAILLNKLGVKSNIKKN